MAESQPHTNDVVDHGGIADVRLVTHTVMCVLDFVGPRTRVPSFRVIVESLSPGPSWFPDEERRRPTKTIRLGLRDRTTLQSNFPSERSENSVVVLENQEINSSLHEQVIHGIPTLLSLGLIESRFLIIMINTIRVLKYRRKEDFSSFTFIILLYRFIGCNPSFLLGASSTLLP